MMNAKKIVLKDFACCKDKVVRRWDWEFQRSSWRGIGLGLYLPQWQPHGSEHGVADVGLGRRFSPWLIPSDGWQWNRW